VNTPLGPFGTIGDAAGAVGQFDANKYLADPYDLMRGVMQALGEGQTSASLADYLVRITDGTDIAATVTLMDTTTGTAVAGITIPAKWTGTGGNLHKVIISQGVPNGSILSFNVTFVSTYSGAQQSETFYNIPGAAAASVSPFWANLEARIIGGDSSRGPSALMGAGTSVSNTAHNPALGTFPLTGGTDGRSTVTDANFFGSDVIGNYQGVYALQGLPVVPSFFQCCGLNNSSDFANLQQVCTNEIMRTVIPFPAGTTTAAAITARNSAGISDKRVMYAKDWIYWKDPISGKLLFTDPVSVLIGKMGALPPNLSPLNKQVLTVVATEHQGVYAAAEIGVLEQNGILVIANPCLGNPYFGIMTGNTTSLNPISQPIEYSRLQDWIGLNFASILGQFVGQPQGVYDPDPTRSACKTIIDKFMYGLYQSSIIVDWFSACNAALNNPTTVQQGYLNATLNYVPFGTVKFVVLKLGTSTSLNPGQALAAAYAQSQAA
jgi:hypothetical protein